MQFTGFHLSVGKTFAGLASSVLKESVAQKIHQENFRIFIETAKTTKLFSHTTLLFMILQNSQNVYVQFIVFIDISAIKISHHTALALCMSIGTGYFCCMDYNA